MQTIQNFIHLFDLSILDIIDFILVWYIFYQVLKIFRGTRAPYMLLAITIFAFIAIIAQILNLSALNWIIDAFKTVGLVALVIVFQPEIRRALTSLGQSRLYRLITRAPEIPLEEIVDAVYWLRDMGFGALIVIQNRMGLQEFVEEGVELDALVSALLIETIFYDDNPLHDGAIIIRENRILSAGVRLPRSSHLPDPLLGLRHEAAVGITEQTDAIAIVVSEERQTVRYAFRGQLSAPLEKEELLRRIEEILYGKQ